MSAKFCLLRGLTEIQHVSHKALLAIVAHPGARLGDNSVHICEQCTNLAGVAAAVERDSLSETMLTLPVSGSKHCPASTFHAVNVDEPCPVRLARLGRV